jgi:hypothetical protein
MRSYFFTLFAAILFVVPLHGQTNSSPAENPASNRASLGRNLILNGDAEQATDTMWAPFWQPPGTLEEAGYGQKPGEWRRGVQGAPHGGCCYFRLEWQDKQTSKAAFQTIDLSALSEEIDQGKVWGYLSGYLGGLLDGGTTAVCWCCLRCAAAAIRAGSSRSAQGRCAFVGRADERLAVRLSRAGRQSLPDAVGNSELLNDGRVAVSLLRFLMFLALAVWVGGIILFIVLAPTAFSVLPTHAMAALIVGPMLKKLHWMAIGAGVVYLLCSLASAQLRKARMPLFSAQHVLIYFMLALTCVSQFVVMPRMAELRESVGDIDLLSLADPVRLHFNALHVWSTRIEGTVLLLGLVVLFLAARTCKSQ